MNHSPKEAARHMRVVDKVAPLDRRGFLRGSGLGAIGVTVVPVTALAGRSASSVEQAFPRLGAAAGRTLVRMARDIFPHDQVPDKFYLQAVAPHDLASGQDAALKKLLVSGLSDLDERARARFGKPYAAVPAEPERVELLKTIETTPFFKAIHGGLVTGLYNNKELWPLFGYEGSSWQKGGYVDRGFADIDWL
ncbi:gluconate 2-dehydrogenase subunit 3 family protein [Hydrogenophaga pseudoflava]|uniref:gluconate 2-dehydrogenase subunit 3 family protein n=1 Tax=Hydrogenophaga pseudoflava TaxID=47421 RepID=UPI0027E4EF7D|nr:gluconate 2-dehydrogenase subunit 3 family protein [Hydrogenophaga pseudoflava]MDQ7747261.1 gluconate 2-dehydrogenase subunit 3 family protein [Hydrogenophaga pseudoflava]